MKINDPLMGGPIPDTEAYLCPQCKTSFTGEICPICLYSPLPPKGEVEPLPRLHRYPFSMRTLASMMDMSLVGSFKITGDWPENAKPYKWYNDPAADVMWLVVSSPMFDEVEEGAIIPEGGPITIMAIPDKKETDEVP